MNTIRELIKLTNTNIAIIDTQNEDVFCKKYLVEEFDTIPIELLNLEILDMVQEDDTLEIYVMGVR